MSKNDLNIGDLAARPKDIEAAAAEKIMGGLQNHIPPSTVVTNNPPTSGPSGTTTGTSGVSGTATIGKGN